MICGIFGMPGAGKSTALACAADTWLRGKSFLGIPASDTIYSTFPIGGCYQLNFDDLGKYYYHDCNLLIDEIMLFADSRNFKQFPAALSEFMALHRHAHINLLWCSQALDCDKRIRDRTERLYKLQTCGGILSAFSVVKPVEHDLKAMVDTYTEKGFFSWSWIYRPRYYKLFDSYAHSWDSKPAPPSRLWFTPDREVDA